MTSFLRTLFSWPNGIVLGNLIASALWATPALIHLHVKLNRHHRASQTARDENAGSLGSCDTERAEPRDVPIGFSPPECKARR